MKTYTGTKTIYATPMTRDAYNTLRGWALPADEDGSDDGYLVEYTDGGKANHPDFAGYISWSPKDVFERAYSPVLPAYQQRVVDEKAELDEKLTKLTAFLPTEMCLSLSFAERGRLKHQSLVMADYSAILGERIAAFPEQK